MGQEETKGAVVAEYMAGGVTLRGLEKKHGINFRTIHRWVKECEGAKGPEELAEGRSRRALVVKETELSADVRRLRKELEEARLYNKLLNAMIDIAEEQFEIPIRKKSGAKQR
jgi:transposase-like protein